MPENIDAYTYRIGRTGRVEKNGDALTFVTSVGASIVNALEQVPNKTIEHRTLQGFNYTVPSPKSEFISGLRTNHCGAQCEISELVTISQVVTLRTYVAQYEQAKLR